jgi:hypothetical protein
MSLINEALKRARQAPVAPAPELHFRPVEPVPTARRTVGVLLPAVLAVIALLTLVLVWQVAQRSSSNDQKLSVAPVAEPNPTAAAQFPTDSAQPQPAKPAALGLAPSAPDNAALAATATNPPAVVEPPPPAPPPLKLQGVVFNPKRPSALISGRTLFIGDRIRDFRVVAISPNSATLTGSAQTNVLSLSE